MIRTRSIRRLYSSRGGSAFALCGAAYIVAAIAIAAIHADSPIVRGWWLVAYLSLVGGVAQILLGVGLLWLARRSAAAKPSRRTTLSQLILWNGGTVMVAVADLLPSARGVLFGSILLVVTLLIFTRELNRLRATELRLLRGWTQAYATLLGFLGVSVAVGTWLAYVRGR